MLTEKLKKFFLKVKSRCTSAVALVLTVVLCVASLLIQYFRRADSLSPLTIIGAVIVPFQEGLNDVGGYLFKSEQDRLSLQES